MIKFLMPALLALSLTMTGDAQGRGGRGGSGGHGSHGSQGSFKHSSSKNYHTSHGSKFSHGHFYRGKNHSHWSHYSWWSKYGCYRYYCPSTSCWYYWSEPRQCYYPCNYSSFAAPTASASFPNSFPIANSVGNGNGVPPVGKGGVGGSFPMLPSE